MSSKKKGKLKPLLKDSTATDVTVSESSNPEDMKLKFEQELIWCIEQLQLGLESQNPDSRQAIEGTKALKILLSSKAPLIKKRQVMRNTFGDYRKKMAEIEQKSTTAAKKGSIVPAVSKTLQKSTFFKKSSTRNPDIVSLVSKTNDSGLQENHSENCNDNNNVTQSSCTEGDADLNSSFQFSFKIEDSDTPESRTEQTQTVPGSENVHVNEVNPGILKVDNSFRFNFTIPS